jgi:general secretion pathway protein G
MGNRLPRGFTLVELVVVILILGILAGIAAPKLLDTSATATDNGLRQTLGIVRDAIEMYAAKNGGKLPPCTATGADFKTALEPYLRGKFPISPVSPANDQIIPTTGTTTAGDASPTSSWKFNTDNGTFIVNSAAATANTDDGATTYDQF